MDELNRILELALEGYSHQAISRHLGRSQGYITLRIRRHEIDTGETIPRVRLPGLQPLPDARDVPQAPPPWPMDEEALGRMNLRERPIIRDLYARRPWNDIADEHRVEPADIAHIRQKWERRTGLMLPRRRSWTQPTTPRAVEHPGNHNKSCECRACQRSREIEAEILYRRKVGWPQQSLWEVAASRPGDQWGGA